MEKRKTKITIPCRISYAHIWHPQTNEDGTPGKYNVSLLIDKSDTKTIERIKAAIKAATIADKERLGKIPPNLKQPLRDADAEGMEDENYIGHYFLNASSKRKPGIVGRSKDPATGRLRVIEDEDEVYSGCYCNVSVNFYGFNVGTNKGIAAGLNNIQKVSDGERLGGGSNPDEDFDDLGEDSDALDSMFD